MDGFEAVADGHGIFSTADAVSAGLTWRDLARLVKDDRVVALTRGWYALSTAPLLREGDSPAERRRHRHALTTRALLRSYDGVAVASHHSGLVLRSLPVYRSDLSRVHLTRTHDTLSRRRPGLTLHEQVIGAGSRDGLIDPAVACIQAGITNGAMAGLVAADALLHRGLATEDDLTAAMGLFRGPGTAGVRRILQHVDARSESPGETRLRHAMTLMGLRAIPQFRIEDGSFLAFVDLLLEAERVCVEFDGFVKYGRTVASPGDPSPGEVVFAEKVREDHIRALGYGFVRVVWNELDDLPLLRRRLEACLAEVRGRGIA